MICTADRPMINKHKVLKDASKLFDLFGIDSPVFVSAKLFVQKIWQLCVEWDEYIAATVRDEWNAILSDIQ